MSGTVTGCQQCSAVHPAARHVQDRAATIALKDQEGNIQVTGTANWAHTRILIQVEAIEVTLHLETLDGQGVDQPSGPSGWQFFTGDAFIDGLCLQEASSEATRLSKPPGGFQLRALKLRGGPRVRTRQRHVLLLHLSQNKMSYSFFRFYVFESILCLKQPRYDQSY